MKYTQPPSIHELRFIMFSERVMPFRVKETIPTSLANNEPVKSLCSPDFHHFGKIAMLPSDEIAVSAHEKFHLQQPPRRSIKRTSPTAAFRSSRARRP